MNYLLACLAAIFVQAPIAAVTVLLPMLLAKPTASSVVFFLYYLVVLFIIAGTVIVLIGLPTHYVMHRLGADTPAALAKIGAILGIAIHVAFFLPFTIGGGFSYGATFMGGFRQLIVDGMPTFWGWLSFLKDTVVFATHGAAGAYAYTDVWDRIRARSLNVAK